MPPASAVAHVVPLVERALQAHAQGATAVAERLCLDVLELAPDRMRALATLYQIRREEGRLPAAEALLRRMVFFDANDLWSAHELGMFLLQRGRPEEALGPARNAVRMAPDVAQAHNLLAMVLTEIQRPHLGEFHYRRALALSGARDPILLANLAWALKGQGKMAEARTLYEESLAAAPDVVPTLNGYSRMEEADRNFGAAEALLDRLEALAPGDGAVKLNRAVIYGRTGRRDEALALLEDLASQTEAAGLGPTELLEKGRLLDQMGRYDDAFAAFIEGKALARTLTGGEYQAELAADIIGRLKRFFVAGRLQMLPRAGVRADVAQPIFILGFPRSGTTLVEQTLSALPAISAGDELPFITELADAMPRMLNSPLAYPEALAELWMADQVQGLDTLRDHYLQRVGQLGVVAAGAGWFTDKMPLNEMHLGLIGLVFPRAPLIHVIRHPLDVMVSAISNLFTHGFNCSLSLETAARHYVAVMELVMQYRAEMSLRYLPVRYEDMVTDQEATVRGLCDFIGVAFDPSCLAFHENRRYARTASYAQVTERLYDRSLARRRHYRAHLEPVIPILAPMIAALGYSVD